MKQLVQQLKDGKMQVLEVPEPAAAPGFVLVRVHYSLISAGTEGGTVRAARKSLLGKALERPQQVKQALDVLRQQGPVQAFRAVMKKLDAYSPLGYSCAGEVIGEWAGGEDETAKRRNGETARMDGGEQRTSNSERSTFNVQRSTLNREEEGEHRTSNIERATSNGDMGEDETTKRRNGETATWPSSIVHGLLSEFRIGDKVACAGGGANHAEVVAVPVNLCVKLAADADLKLAAYNTLGAIALQGIRQADLRLGESCAVIGLGLIGQLTGLMLRASGVKVVGIDTDPLAVEMAGGEDETAKRRNGETASEEKIENRTSNAQRPTLNVQRPTPNGEKGKDETGKRGNGETEKGEDEAAGGRDGETAGGEDEHRTSNIERPTLNVQRSTSNAQRPTPNEEGAGRCADLAMGRDAAGIVQKIMEFSGGLGVDAVIITAGTDSLDPVNFAGEICRKKGRVVVVGAVPTGFDRDPHWYRKELELRMSCSYGPGRYDPDYEEKGLDYPPAYVRWTEKRNMEAFQELVHSGRIDLRHLTSHEFPLERAGEAYELILKRTEPFLGVLLRYDAARTLERLPIVLAPPAPAGRVNLAFIGAGNYAQGNLLPNLPSGDPAVTRAGVFDLAGPAARRVAERFGFSFCAATEADILENAAVNTVFVATRHDSHAAYVLKCLRAGKNVFVEKPLAINREELRTIENFYHEGYEESHNRHKRHTGLEGNHEGHEADSPIHPFTDSPLPPVAGSPIGRFADSSSPVAALPIHPFTDSPILPVTDSPLPPVAVSPIPRFADSPLAPSSMVHGPSSLLMVGFNRRFAPLTGLVKERLGAGPKAMLYRVNAGAIAADHWVQDPALGGGRIVGEVCHFVDFLAFLAGAKPSRAQVFVMPTGANTADTLTVNLEFADGSIGTVVYLANGAKSLEKEYIEVYQAGTTAIIRDFRQLEIHGGRKVFRKRLLSQDKGQRAMIGAFVAAVRDGRPSPIPVGDLLAVTRTTFCIQESLRTRKVIEIKY